MGIPVFFKTIVSQYPRELLKTSSTLDRPVDLLCLDLNCLIHPCCRSIMGTDDPRNESKMIETILSSIEHLITYTRLTKTLYIAIDGVAPKAKMKQQRQRRHKSAYERTNGESTWNTNAISPGTHFMQALHHALRQWMAENTEIPHIILSDSEEVGEGEHKILHYLRSLEEDTETKTDTYVSIYGLDADLIMLGLLSNIPNLYLLRERTEYNVEGLDEEYLYLDISALRRCILRDIGIASKYGDHVIIHDYIFLCFLLGNDFINHGITLSLRYNGLSHLLRAYQSLQERYQGYYRLIDTSLPHLIHLTFFKELMRDLANQEPRILEERTRAREKQSKRLYTQYGTLFSDWQASLALQIQDGATADQAPSPRIPLALLYSDLHARSENLELQEMMNHLPMFYLSEERRDLQHYYAEISRSEMSREYLDSLVWTAHYYFRECRSWSWCTKYHKVPLLKDFSQYLQGIEVLSFDADQTPMSIPEQLHYIFPNSSHHLHPYDLSSDPLEMYLHVLHHRYLWECPLEEC